MKELFLLLALMFNPDAQVYNGAQYQALWTKVDAAIEAGKPQTAASLLANLEQMTVDAGDTLEQLAVMKCRYECLAKYNWKQANNYYPHYSKLKGQVMDNLDHYLEKYVNHRRVDGLVYEKILKLKAAEDSADKPVGQRYREIRRMCMKAADVFSTSARRKDFLAIVNGMDAKYIGIYSEKSFVYPGDTLRFTLNGSNIGQCEFSVYKLNARYDIYGSDVLGQIAGKGRQVYTSTIDSFRNEYNIREKVETSYAFASEGIYAVFCNAEGMTDMTLVNVSSVAVATREMNGRNEVYVADARTGKPAANATIYARHNNYDDLEANGQKVFVLPSYISQKEYALNGFTPLTQNLYTKKCSSAEIVAEVGGDRWAPALGISEPVEVKEAGYSATQMHYIYTDRKLYRAGDTVQFKIIALSSNGESGKVLSGKRVSLSLYPPTGSKAASKVTLRTNSMGSAAGRFVIPADGKHGPWRISSDKGDVYFRVEAYKDPKYEVVLDKIETPYTFDEVIVQKGQVRGLTGEPVAQARVEYTVTSYRTLRGAKSNILAQGDVITAADGSFEIPFSTTAPVDATTSACRISVKAIAPAGEICETGRVVTVSKDPLTFTSEFDVSYRMDTVLLVDKSKAATLTLKAFNADGVEQKIPGSYTLDLYGMGGARGEFTFGTPINVDLQKFPSAEYTLEYKASVAGAEQSGRESVVLLTPDDRDCLFDCDIFFYPVQSRDAIDFVVGTSSEDLYLELEIFDGGKQVYRRPLHLKNCAQHIQLDYSSHYGDQVEVSLFGIKDFGRISERHIFSRTVPSENFDIKISSLRDRTTPRTRESFTVEAEASELMVSIYDVTCDRYGRNTFTFNPIRHSYKGGPYIWTNFDPVRPLYFSAPMRKTRTMAIGENSIMLASATADIIEDSAAAEGSEEYIDETDVRDDFSQTIAFIPQLQIPSSGKATVSFTTGEALSAFRIAMLAHTRELRSGVSEARIIVNKPVKIELFTPLFAVEGDRLVIKANVSNSSDKSVSGRATLDLSDGDDDLPLQIYPETKSVSLAPGESTTLSWEVTVPGLLTRMDVTAAIDVKGAKDAEKRQIAVSAASRTITEASSFIIGYGRSKQSCIRDLKARFPYPNAQIRYEEYTTADILKDVLKKPAYPKGNNMIEWLDAFYINQMRGCLLGGDSVDVNFSRVAASRLERLQHSDGGYGWFPGNSSSDFLTLMFLQKTYYLREVGQLPRNTSINSQIEKSLKYIEKRIIEVSSKKKWDWRDLTFFFAARVEHPNYTMSPEVREVLKQYLKKCRGNWKDLSVVEKARLCTVLEATGENGQLYSIMHSLRDYAVRNDNVGCYFPNAVMPYRGNLSAEIYAHSLLVVTFAEMEQMDIAKGIMKWLLLQKHNQQWESNMASADAIFALLKYKAPSLKFGAVYYTYTAPMLSAGESANQLGVKRIWWRNGKRLNEGDKIYVGDKVEVRYEISNSENRSFVEMKAGRPACFYPVDERSYGSEWFYCERDLRSTTYYFQRLAEENTTLSETFYVTQEGTFNTSLVEIESLYAPEYRGHTGAFRAEADNF